MDYILHDALSNIEVDRGCITYNIWCKYHVNLDKRAHERFDLNFIKSYKNKDLRGAIPKFHIMAHGLECHVPYLLNYMPGVGRLDGEGPEREWAATNELGRQTIENGPGAQHGVLNDHVNYLNFKRLNRLCECFIDADT
jgi:hypothetical protein